MSTTVRRMKHEGRQQEVVSVAVYAAGQRILRESEDAHDVVLNARRARGGRGLALGVERWAATLGKGRISGRGECEWRLWPTVSRGL